MQRILKTILPPLDFGWNHVRASCALAACHNKLLVRPTPRSRPGIHMGRLWYCSPDCFATAARITFAALSFGRIVEMPPTPRLSLGLAMLDRALLTEEQLRMATAESDRCGTTLETALLHLGMATEKQIAAGRAAQWGYPYLAVEPSSRILQAALPKTLLQACSAAPVHVSPDGKRLVLGFVHRVDHTLLQATEEITGCRPEPCFITPSEFRDQMKRLTPPPDYREAVPEDAATPAQMGRSAGWFAVETGASDARFAACQAWIWARITGKRGTVDLLFARGGQAGDAAVPCDRAGSQQPVPALG